MYTKAYEIRKSHDGYGVYELTLKDGRVSSEVKLIDHDIFIVTIGKLAAHLQLTCPNLKPIIPNKDMALPEKDESNKKVEVKN